MSSSTLILHLPQDVMIRRSDVSGVTQASRRLLDSEVYFMRWEEWVFLSVIRDGKRNYLLS
ncbi:hypothetical protein INR49_018117 [Caranx melampygus]|nr:hypothetical protein INR49_018117 [Caranx melampygus]